MRWCKKGEQVAARVDDTRALDDLARALLIQEHASLRAEILASYGYAQSIVKWTLATFAAIAAAGLVAINDATGANPNTLLTYMVFVVFGIGLPAIVWLYSYTWVGELIRAERAGSYLRALEASIANVKGLNDRLGIQPLRWESFIWVNREVKKSPWGKQVITYLGTAGVFLGTTLGCFVILWILVWFLVDSGKFEPAAYIWVGASAAVNLVCLVLFILMCRKVFRLGHSAAPLKPVYGDIFPTPTVQK